MRLLFPVALLSVLGRQVYAAAGDLCTIADLKVALVNQKLFWIGGAYIWNTGVNGAQGNSSFLQTAEHTLYWQNLADSFSVKQFIPGAALENSQIPADAPSGAAGSFFYDDTSLYLFSGLGSDPRVDNKLWSFNTGSNQWSQVTVDGGRFQHGNRYGGLHTSVPSAGLSYFTGGADTSITGMVKFDSSSPDKPKWENQTDPDPSKGAAIPRIQGGEMVFLSLGKSGVLLAFGGYDTSQPGTQFGSSFPWDQRDLSQISVYDISSNTWYDVPATGDIPPRRSEFCAAVSTAPDHSSFQVTMYGGWDQASQSANEDLYVLTVPSFQWIKLDAHKGFDADGSGDAKGRSHHKCVTWNNAQMLVMGGMLDAGKGVLNNRSCDSNYLPWRVLDTSTYTWSTDFKTDARYAVPDVVTQVIGGSGAGNAVKKAPVAGWNNAQLESIFSLSSSLGLDGERTPTVHGGKGYIAGAVIGCLLAIGIILGALHIRRNRQRSKAAHYVEDLTGKKKRVDGTPLEVWIGRNKAGGADPRDEVFTVTNSYYEVHPESASPKTGRHARSNSTRANSLTSPGSKIPHPLDTSDALDRRGMQDQRSPMKKPTVPRTPAKSIHDDDEKLL